VKVAADANVVPAALGGGAAGRILESPDVEVCTVRSVIQGIEEYIPRIGQMKGVDEALLRMTPVNLPLTVVEPERYAGRREETAKRIAARDPVDVELLALAFALDIPVGSNDSDFEESRVERYTPAELLHKLKKR